MHSSLNFVWKTSKTLLSDLPSNPDVPMAISCLRLFSPILRAALKKQIYSPRKETVDIDILITSGNGDRKSCNLLE